MSDDAFDRDWLLANLPHAGEMNLLDAIVSWDATTLHARATSHLSPTNPLRRAGILPVAAGVEYGAQAAAAHGALAASMPSDGGYLASMRGITFHVARLDDLASPLEVIAEQLGSSDAGVLYGFRVSCEGRALVEGRVTVAFPQ
jgi:predicted hotdog family 3-hydroxylacyl-ACP dehydratase